MPSFPKWGGLPRIPLPFPVVLLAILAVAAPLRAQQTGQDCRCVDRDGNPIENCVCLRTPVVGSDFALLRSEPRARIGVELEEHTEGARVARVEERSPAARAGLRAGDVITRVDAQSLRQPLPDAARERAIDEGGDVAVQRLMALARSWEPGRAVEVEVVRSGERHALSVEPEANPGAFAYLRSGEMRLQPFAAAPGTFRFEAFGPEGRAWMLADSLRTLADSLGTIRFQLDSLAVRLPRMTRPGLDSLTWLGFRLDSLARPLAALDLRFSSRCAGARGDMASSFSAPDCVDGARLVALNPTLGDYFGTPRGVLVTDVAEGSMLGLRGGDVILSVGERSVEAPADVIRILAGYRAGEEVTMRVRRRGEEVEVRGTRR